ncbi:PLC-like phosphodiesterase [Pluteus cervinus]|uniref:PLC-like phosphodiesterase n=1 Tax=Pluteus cervinus TaxID=181527 RepID=A0ACD3B1S4_9AGAR|nr:PLC-like phosphodiesterase [Pluteus cervinus]
MQITIINLTTSQLSCTCHDFLPKSKVSKPTKDPESGKLIRHSRDYTITLNSSTSKTMTNWKYGGLVGSRRLTLKALTDASSNLPLASETEEDSVGCWSWVFPAKSTAAPTVLEEKTNPGLPTRVSKESKELLLTTTAAPAAAGETISLSLSSGAPFKRVCTPKDSPWRIYTTKVGKKHYNVIILKRRDASAFLSDFPDTLPLSSLCLPGTHETIAFHGWPISQCQSGSTLLDQQLQQGIRFIDIRLALVSGKLITYHGIYPERTLFQDILTSVHNFLTSPNSSRETLILSIKQEDYNTTPLPDFSNAVHSEITQGPGGMDMWFLKNKIPTLGEVRGKVILFSRFGGNGDGWEDGLEGLGIHPTTWPDSDKDGFSWTCKDTLVRTQDWYEIPSFLSIPEKVQLSTQLLLPYVDPTNPPPPTPTPTLSITFFSASKFPLSLPPTIAQGSGFPSWGLGFEGVNSRVVKWLLDRLAGVPIQVGGATPTTTPTALNEKPATGSGDTNNDGIVNVHASGEPRLRGWALSDFYDDPEESLVPLLIECNYWGRKTGEEGW